MEALKLNKKEKGCFVLLFSIIILIVISGQLLVGHLPHGPENKALQHSRNIGLALWQYAQDHEGKNPEGRSSTEIFQKLLDGDYLGTENGDRSDVPDLLYYPMPGKVRAPPGTKILKPENVCWDVTCCVDTSSSDQLPTLFLTGYKVSYQAGASAVPLPHPLRSWSDWWRGRDYPDKFIVVHYQSNLGVVLKAAPDGTIPNFIPVDFDPKGKTYRQLTPDGELPP